MSETTYEPLVTDFIGVDAENNTEEIEHTKFLLDNGYALSVIRITEEILTDTPDDGIDYIIGRFDVCAARMIEDGNARAFYEFLGVFPYTTDGLELDFLPLADCRATNLTSSEVNDLLHKLNEMESVV